jgi:hypothetical protein
VEVDGIIKMFRTEIQAGSFNVAALFADESGCDWAYSIGLEHNFNHPELLVVGLEATIAGAVIELLGEEIAAGRHLGAGEVVRLAGGMNLQVRDVDPLWLARGDWFVLGRAVMETWGQRWPETLQLVWSDRQGEFPDLPGDPAWSLKQPLLMHN